MKQVHRAINAALRSNNQPTSQAFTKVYALLFCGWTEANFSKVIHTPHGFELNEIAQVKEAQTNGIGNAWKTSVRLGLRHLDAKRGSFAPNALRKLESVIDIYVFDPSLLRNKLAHGQWVIALNRDNDAVQNQYTTDITALDIVKIQAWILGHELLAQVVENLIESPTKAFMRDWYEYVVRIEDQMVEAKGRTLGDHIDRLLAKEELTGAKLKRRGA